MSHYAPASQWSCVIVNAAIAALLSGGAPDLKKLLEAAKADGCPDLAAEAQGAGVPTGFLENAMRGRTPPGDTKWMQGNRGPNWHTVLTMQAGLWAATTPLNFEEALVALVNSGRRHGHQRSAGRRGARSSLRRLGNSPCAGPATSPSGNDWRVWRTVWSDCDASRLYEVFKCPGEERSA